MQLRVMVYNVRGFRDGTERLARLITGIGPDLLLVNESGSRRRLRRFAGAVHMQAATDPWSPLRRRVKNAVLVRPPWRVGSHRLQRFPGSARWYPRGALIAKVVRPSDRFWAISVHLGLHPAERARHADAVARLAASFHGSVVIGGDLNERPDGRAASLLAAWFRDAWSLAGEGSDQTFPAADPAARIDYLFVSGEVAVEEVVVGSGADAPEVSDHRPLIAELTLDRRG